MTENQKSGEYYEYDKEGDILKRGLFPVLIRPNIGQPDFIHPKNITAGEYHPDTLPTALKFEFEGLIASSKKSTIDEICEAVDNKLFIYPFGEKIINGRAERLERITLTVKELKPTQIIDIDENEYSGNPQKYLVANLCTQVFCKRSIKNNTISEIGQKRCLALPHISKPVVNAKNLHTICPFVTIIICRDTTQCKDWRCFDPKFNSDLISKSITKESIARYCCVFDFAKSQFDKP